MSDLVADLAEALARACQWCPRCHGKGHEVWGGECRKCREYRELVRLAEVAIPPVKGNDGRGD
jgi:DnaJ-class molecular chaperone